MLQKTYYVKEKLSLDDATLSICSKLSLFMVTVSTGATEPGHDCVSSHLDPEVWVFFPGVKIFHSSWQPHPLSECRWAGSRGVAIRYWWSSSSPHCSQLCRLFLLLNIFCPWRELISNWQSVAPVLIFWKNQRTSIHILFCALGFAHLAC